MIDNSKEYILCAAILYKQYPSPVHTVVNATGLVLCGHRHADIIGQCTTLLGLRQAEMGSKNQGFLTSENRFVDRMTAMYIAYQAGQVDFDTYCSNKKLYSEDLY